nr:MAG TPA: Membrane-bound metallopeptidase [Caudoviricetes sp.]
MNEYIISQNCNGVHYAYSRGRFWRWDESAHVWKESHLLAQKFGKAKTVEKRLTPEAFLTSNEFIPMDDYELPDQMLTALRDAKPCRNAPVEPVEECTAPVPAHTADVAEPCGNVPASPSFDFSALGDLSGQAAEADHQFDLHYGTAQDEYLISCIYLARIHALTAKAGRYGGGTWTKWYESKGLSHGSVTKMVQNGEAFNSSTVDELKQLPNLTRKDLNLIARSGCADQVVAAAGDSQRVQDLLAQIKSKDAQLEAAHADISGLKDRATAAEAREEEAWKLQSKSEAKAKDAETELEAVTADLNGLYDRAAQAEARNTALLDERAEYVQRIKELESRPIEVMHDPEETDRLAHQYAYGIAADMTEELRTKNNQQSQTIAALQKELEAARSTNGYDHQSDLETVCACIGSMEQMWGTALPAYERLSGKDLRTATDTLQDVIGRLYGDMARTAEDGEN